MVLLSAFIINFGSGEIDMNTVRSAFGKAADNKKLCNEMIDALKASAENNLCLAYLGGYQAVWANHVTNPFSKLQTFNDGKKNIEKAVRTEPGNLEIRLIRYSVQQNAPSFLDYSSRLNEDEKFIRKNLHAISNPLVVKMANELLNRQE